MSRRLVIRREEPFGPVGPFWFMAYDLARGRMFKWRRADSFREVGTPKNPSPRVQHMFEWNRDGRYIAARKAYRARLIYAAAHGMNAWTREYLMMDVHHRNGDCTDDRPENLELIDPITHRLLEYDRYMEQLQQRIEAPGQMLFWEDA